MPPRKKRKTLHVLFDTNAIFADSFEHVISRKAAAAITDHSKHGDLDIVWIIPEVVRLEREYQMRDKFRHVLTPTKQAEQLFGANWEISQETIDASIASRIDQQLAAYKISVRACNAALVDLNKITHDAAFRVPPFEPGPTEKGFRDAILCETFYQLAKSLSGNETAVLVSDDKRVQLAVSARMPTARVLENIEGLRDEINLRVGNVDAQTASLIENKASKLMFDFSNVDDQTALWSRENLHTRIWAKYQQEINELWDNSNASATENFLAPTRLVKKEGTRVFFSTLYTANGQATVWVPDPSPSKPPIAGGMFGLGNQSDSMNDDYRRLSALVNANPVADSTHLTSYYGNDSGKALMTPLTTAVATLLTAPQHGKWVTVPVPAANVSILWSATLSKQMRLTRAKVDDFLLLKPSMHSSGNL
ncbi:PIN domain-containing protein [Caballeronia sp. 15711]|uniref:PIN domain-containing protein n=1 Tax=Caballeronia sp. 15711 TaxID=3391029 RepID=UPI0039E46F82